MSAAPRTDVYGRVHKGLRKALFDLAYLAGRTDWTSSEELDEIDRASTGVMRFLRHHGHNEDTYALPILLGKCPDLVIEDSSEHELIEREIDAMERMVQSIHLIVEPLPRKAEGERYYHRLLLFIADYMRHMHHEETVTTELFHQHCTDEEINAGTRQIIANTAPSDMGYMLAYMVPAIDPHDRVSLFSAMRSTAPPPAFEAACAIAERTLDAGEWTQLRRAIETAPVEA